MSIVATPSSARLVCYCFTRHFKGKQIIRLFICSPDREVLKVSYCDQSMSVVRRQQFALKAYSYTPGSVDSKLGRKHRDDL